MKHFNQLTPSEAERLALLSEELGETIQAVGKILRHGYENTHPDGGPTNRQSLERELGDVYAAVTLMWLRDDISTVAIQVHKANKLDNVEQYLHHQEDKF